MTYFKISEHKENRWWSSFSIFKSTFKDKAKLFSIDQNPKIGLKKKKSFFPCSETTKNWENSDRFVINPTSTPKFAWDTLISLQVVYLSFIIPYSISFTEELDNIIIWSIELFFVLDIILNFNTACFICGVLHTKRKKIALHYLSTTLVLDLLSALPYELFIEDMNITSSKDITFEDFLWVRLLWMWKLGRLLKIKKLMYNLEDFFPGPCVYLLTKMVSFVLLAALSAHWISCVLHGVWFHTLGNEPEVWKLYYNDKLSRYLNKFEQVMVTMTTVGYGNITPQTIPEKIVMICVMCFTSGFMGYMVGGIKSALSKSVKEKKYLNDIKQKFRRYMKTHKTPHKLRIKIIGYLDYLYTYQKKNILKENEILRELSLPLQRDIYTFTRGHLLSKSAAFLGFSSTFLNYLGEKLEIEIFSPRDLIFKQGQKSTNMYFVRHGRVEIFHQATTTVFSEITHNQYFGEIGFFLGCKRLASARSVDFCELFSLDREDFNSILRKMPRDEELTRIIKAQCKASDLSYLGVRCYFCDGSGHVVSACNNYVWKVNNKDIILNSKYMKNKTGQKIVLDEYDVNLRRFDIKHLTRYSLNNVSLDETSGYEIYNNRDSLAAKAKEFDHRRITKERAQNTVRFLLDEEMDEENTDLNVLPEDMKFGKIYVNRRKTLLDQSSLSNSRDGLMKDLEIDSLKTFEISAWVSPVNSFISIPDI